MKKIVLSMVMILTMLPFVACGNSNGDNSSSNGNNSAEAYAEMLKVNEKMENMQSMDIDMDMSVKIDTESISISGNTKQILEPEMQMELNMKMNMLGEEIDTISYLKDGYMYTSMQDLKYKTSVEFLDLEELKKQANTGLTDFTFDEDAIIDSSIKTVNDGKEISFALNGEYVTDSTSKILGSLTDNIPLDSLEVSYGDFKYTIVSDNDSNMKSMSMVFDANMTLDEQTMVLKYDISLNVNKLNDVVIDFPSDLDDYIEIEI